MLTTHMLALLAVTGAAIQEPPSYVFLPQGVDSSFGRGAHDLLVYWNTTHVVPHDDDIEVELRLVAKGLRGSRPISYDQRYRISCEFGSHRSEIPTSTASEKIWSNPRFTDPGALALVTDQVCGFAEAPPEGPRLSTTEAVFEDGLGRLGYESVEAAMQLPDMLQIVPRLPELAAPSGDESGTYDLVYGPDDDHRAVFLKRVATGLNEGSIQGRSVWALGVGQPRRDRAYAMRDFRVDCTSRKIAVAQVRTWPSESLEMPDQTLVPVGLVDRIPSPGSASETLVSAICSGAQPEVSASSLDELAAYVGNPAEGPAFAVRANLEPISQDVMRWVRAPDPTAVSAAYPDNGLQPGEKVLTTVGCIVTRTYALANCRPLSSQRGFRDAHMALVDEYVPARTTITGEDTAGRRVEFSIRWGADKSSIEPRRILPQHMVWRRQPSAQDVRREYGSGAGATARMTCEITPTYQLTGCEAESYMGRAGGILGEALVRLSPLFEAAPTTSLGEPTAGRKTLITFRLE